MNNHNKVFFLPSSQHPSYSRRGWHLRWNIGYLRAQLLYRPIWRIKHTLGFGPKVIFGARVSFLSSVRVFGPGIVYLGDDVICDSKPDFYTHGNKAEIKVGSKSFINGTRFGCSQKISIGEECIIADARMMDTDFHSLSKNRLDPKSLVKTAPIEIGRNVWIAAGAAILKGVRVGDNSVVAFGSVVVSNVNKDKIAAGNPAKEIAEVPD